MSPPDVEAHLMDTSRQTYLRAMELLGILAAEAQRQRKAPRSALLDNCVLASPVRDLEAMQASLDQSSGRPMLVSDPLEGARYRRTRLELAVEEASSYQEEISLVGITRSELKLKVRRRETEAPLSRVSDLWLRSDGRIGLILDGTLVVPPLEQHRHVFFEPS